MRQSDHSGAMVETLFWRGLLHAIHCNDCLLMISHMIQVRLEMRQPSLEEFPTLVFSAFFPSAVDESA